VEAYKLELTMNSLEFLQAVYRDDEIPLYTRLRAAIAAAPYEHPRLSVQALVTPNEEFAKRLELAITRSAKVRIEQPKLVTDLRLPPTRLRRL
jgi:hypothetical protein